MAATLIVLMEALASEVPVIATTVAGVAELVEDGVHGYLIRPGDPDALAARLRDLAADPALRAKMGAAGREKVIAEFDIDAEAARLLTLFINPDHYGDRTSP